MQLPLILLANNPSSPLSSSPRFQFFFSRPFLPILNRNASVRFNLLGSSSDVKLSAGAVRFDAPVIDVSESEVEECQFVVETCITRTLSPALTVEHGLRSIQEAVEKLKLKPSLPSHGVFRFQVAVPPSPKALSWFCCQAESGGVFPLFFLSKERENPSCKDLHLNRTRGVLGIGAAMCFSGGSGKKRSSTRRFLSGDVMPVNCYGFMDATFDADLASMKHQSGSFYFLIPEIELDEREDVSILVATLAWNDNLLCTFEEATRSFESSICQARCHFWPTTDRCRSKCIKSSLRTIKLAEDKTFHMASANALLLESRNYKADTLQLREAAFSCQFCFKLSPTIGVSSNMLDDASGRGFPLQDYANINAVWASLIVEECSRLGLTYFCIAPGSRSSPLAIAASTHSLTTCIACFDERSLAFHAVGYGKGSHKPAVIITSSGTAVSNLLPAVVEASQDFVPLILLTADRPPELWDSGANQTINQVNHFGSFVRFFFSLPPPTDDIPARMVLTTLDSAVHWSTSSPHGPVHINCQFREPLHGGQVNWALSCLKGLDSWMSSAEPFTKYIKVENSFAENGSTCLFVKEVLKIIQEAKQGLLLVSATHSEDEIWAALLLAKHLKWPVVADILSGLRLRKVLSSFPEADEKVLFVDHLDHALISDAVKDCINFDVIIQIGSRITSKRISLMLEEECSPCSYILVDNHPCRHDPSHFVTHRVQCSILEFVDACVRVQFLHGSSGWYSYLRALDKTVAQDIMFQIHAEDSLTEPYVAHAISEAFSAESALFVGNSMAIRDADMYGRSWDTYTHSAADMMLNSDLPYLGVRVAGNRGASGIDGLLSTATGFASGCKKRVLCVLGDVSFLHDTNGLALLSQRLSRKPMTVVVLNNHGGAIFSLLPIADRTDPRLLNQYFYTSHNISIQKLCMAHGVNHLLVKTKAELQDALQSSQNEDVDRVIEVESSINANSTFHSTLRNSACQAADHASSILSRFSVPDSISQEFFRCKIHKMEYSLYKIELRAPTSSSIDHNSNQFHKEGYILSLYLDDGSVGHGEVAPLEIHKENLMDVEEQLRFLAHVIEGIKILFSLPLMNGSFSSWIWNNLGIPECSIFPSVRCGLEMAILNAIAVRQGSSFLNIPQNGMEKEVFQKTASVQICALIDSVGSPTVVASIASSLVEEGFTAMKLKVARRADPIEDAAVVQEVRKKVGQQIQLRVDANRKWTYEEAIQFGSLVKDCHLQYIEEPVKDEEDIIKYCEESGLPVALDETIDKFQGNPLNMLVKFSHPGIVAVVIKPSVIGGFEKAVLIAQWAQWHRKMAVISAAFESSLGLSTYVLLSYYLEVRNADHYRAMNGELSPCIAHGLGTYRWLKEDVTTRSLGIHRDLYSGFVGASVSDTIHFLRKIQINRNVIQWTFTGEQVSTYNIVVKSKNISCAVKLHEVGGKKDDDLVLFLHGFLGTGEDWIPIMKAISGSARCISVDLPGHGESKMYNHGRKQAKQEASLSVEELADVLHMLIQDITPGKVTLVGYSMGARIALHMALRFNHKINGAVIISGSPGLRDTMARKVRQAKDDSRAQSLIAYGLELFVDNWYAGDLWKSLRTHPCFKKVVASRSLNDDVHGLAEVMSGLSTGRQLPLWKDLKRCNSPILLIVGEKDEKFKAIAQKMCHEFCQDDSGRQTCEVVEVPNCGHAVHLENPLPVISALRQFFTKLRNFVPEHNEVAQTNSR